MKIREGRAEGRQRRDTRGNRRGERVRKGGGRELDKESRSKIFLMLEECRHS